MAALLRRSAVCMRQAGKSLGCPPAVSTVLGSWKSNHFSLAFVMFFSAVENVFITFYNNVFGATGKISESHILENLKLLNPCTDLCTMLLSKQKSLKARVV